MYEWLTMEHVSTGNNTKLNAFYIHIFPSRLVLTQTNECSRDLVSEEIIGLGLFARNTPRFLRSGFKYGEIALEMLIQFENCCDVATTITIVGCAPNCQNRFIEMPFVSLKQYLFVDEASKLTICGLFWYRSGIGFFTNSMYCGRLKLYQRFYKMLLHTSIILPPLRVDALCKSFLCHLLDWIVQQRRIQTNN